MSEDLDDTRMTLGEHLAELRTRLIRGFIAVGIAFFVAWSFYESIAAIVMKPYHDVVPRIDAHFTEVFADRVVEDPSTGPTFFEVPEGVAPETWFAPERREEWSLVERWRAPDRLSALNMTEGFVFILRICLYVALVVGGPILIYQLWGFIAAGLYPQERKAALRYFPYSVGLFVVGVLFGFFVMVPFAMYFLATAFDSDMVEPQYRVEDYLSLLTSLCIALACVFQLPVLMTFAARMGLVEPAKMASWRSYFIVGAFVVAAILTPPDPVTQAMMAVPMIFLFEIGLLAARWFAKPRGEVAA